MNDIRNFSSLVSWAKSFSISVKNRSKQMAKSWLRVPLTPMVSFILDAPPLRRSVSRLLKIFPTVHNRLLVFALNNQLLDHQRRGLNSKMLGHDATRFYNHFPNVTTYPETLRLSLSKNSVSNRTIRLVGHVEGHYSLAIVNRGLALAFNKAPEYNVSFVPFHGVPYKHLPEIPGEDGQILSTLFSNVTKEPDSRNAISVVHHYPYIVDTLPSGVRFIIFPWEETAVPKNTIEFINDNFDGVFTPSSWGKRVLQNSGCRIQVFVYPQGVDHIIDASVPPLDKLSPLVSGRVRFLHVSSAFERKGIDVLLRAYFDAFNVDSNVELYIKTFPNPHNRVREQLFELTNGRSNAPKVTIDEGSIDDQGILELYRSSHALVLPTRGEGFNLPAAEALALGLPLIVTGASAHVDFCTTENAILIDYSCEPSRSHLRSFDSCWYEPSANNLRDVFIDFRERLIAGDPAIEAKRLFSVDYIRSTYSWDKSAFAIVQAANYLSLIKARIGDPLRMAVISPWATRCGIAEYCRDLLFSFLYQPDYTVEIFCDSRTDSNSDGAEVCWFAQDQRTVIALLNRLKNDQHDVIFIQHHPGLIHLTDECCSLLAALKDGGRVVVIELHSTHPLTNEARLSERSVRLLARLDRVIVHKPEDVNNLLSLGLSENVMLLPLGTIQPLDAFDMKLARESLCIEEDALVLGSFGFAMPHKGLDQILLSIKELSSSLSKKVYFLSVNSARDHEGSLYIETLREMATELGVGEFVIWKNDYLAIEESLRLLSCSDFVLFPYKHTQESASAAVNIGLATLRPVLVSPLSIFSDIYEVVHQMDDSGSKSIISAIEKISKDLNLGKEISAERTRWIKDRSTKELSKRLSMTIKALVCDRDYQMHLTHH